MHPARINLILLSAVTLLAQSAGTNLITTIAGTDGSLGTGGPGNTTPLPPGGNWGKPAIDAAGNIYFSLSNLHIVLKLTPAGRLERFAGNGFAKFAGDGGRSTLASLNTPRDIAIDSRHPGA